LEAAQAHLLRLVLPAALVVVLMGFRTLHLQVEQGQMVKVMLVEEGFLITQLIQIQVVAAVLGQLVVMQLALKAVMVA
jgi:hypothetical protein